MNNLLGRVGGGGGVGGGVGVGGGGGVVVVYVRILLKSLLLFLKELFERSKNKRKRARECPLNTITNLEGIYLHSHLL